MPKNNQQSFDAIRVARQRYPGLADWSDQEIVQNLSDPERFRTAFPEYKDLDDETIQFNMAKIGPAAGITAPTPAELQGPPEPPDNRGPLRKGWDWINIGVTSPESWLHAYGNRDFNRSILSSAAGGSHIGAGLVGKDNTPAQIDLSNVPAARAVSQFSSDMTSPLSIGLMAAGPVAEGMAGASATANGARTAKALKAGAKTIDVLNRGANAALAVQGGANAIDGGIKFYDEPTLSNFVQTAAGVAQAGFGAHTATRGLFAGRMKQPYIGLDGKPVRSSEPELVVGNEERVPLKNQPGDVLTHRASVEYQPGDVMTRQQVFDNKIRSDMQPDLAEATQLGALDSAKEYLSGTFAGRGAFQDAASRNATAFDKAKSTMDNLINNAVDATNQARFETDLTGEFQNSANEGLFGKVQNWSQSGQRPIAGRREIRNMARLYDRAVGAKLDSARTAWEKAEQATQALKDGWINVPPDASVQTTLTKLAPLPEAIITGGLAYLHHPWSAALVPATEYLASKAMTNPTLVRNFITPLYGSTAFRNGAAVAATRGMLNAFRK